MSEESATPDLVELTGRLAQAASKRDFDAVMSFYAPDAELVGAEVGRFEGAAAMRGFFEDMARPFSDLHGEVDEAANLGNGVVFAVITVVGHPVGSSREVRFHYAAVPVFADGVIVRQTNYMDIDQARADARRLAEERGLDRGGAQ